MNTITKTADLCGVKKVFMFATLAEAILIIALAALFV